MIKRIFHKSKANTNTSTTTTTSNQQTSSSSSSSNLGQTTSSASSLTTNDQSILHRLKHQIENVVSLKQHTNKHDLTTSSEHSTASLSAQAASNSELHDQLDENQKTMTNLDGKLLLEEYNKHQQTLTKQDEASIATKLNDLYQKQLEIEKTSSLHASALSLATNNDDEINSVLFTLPETTSAAPLTTSSNTSSSNKIIITTTDPANNESVVSRRQSMSQATTIEYPLRARILRHLSYTTNMQSASLMQQQQDGISCSSSSCSLFNKSSSSLYSSTVCLCMTSGSIASSTQNLKQSNQIARQNLLNVDAASNERRQSWGSYTNLNINSKSTTPISMQTHHPKCPLVQAQQHQQSQHTQTSAPQVHALSRKNSAVNYLHPNYTGQMVLQSSSSTSSTSSLLSTSHKLKQQSTLPGSSTHNHHHLHHHSNQVKLLTPTTYRSHRINSINNLTHLMSKSAMRKETDMSHVTTNLLRFRADKLGSSAPNLFVAMKEPVPLSRKNSVLTRQHHGSIQINNNSATTHKPASSNPTCCSCSATTTAAAQPTASSTGAPNACCSATESSTSNASSLQNGAQHQQSQQQLQNSTSLLTAKNLDARRWSFASMHSSSSGYSGSIGVGDNLTQTPPSNQILTQHSSSSSSTNKDEHASSKLDHHHYDSSSAVVSNDENEHSKPNCPNCSMSESNEAAGASAAASGAHHTGQSKAVDRRSRICSSSNESQLDDSSSYDGGYAGGSIDGRSPINFNFRQRARSLSCSPLSTSYKHNSDSDMILIQNEKFKEKFPKACKQMEENLQNFIETNKDLNKIDELHDPAARFIHNQIIELANWCLEKSRQNQLTCAYFDEMTNSLEKLLIEASDKCINVETSVNLLRKFVKKFLLIVSRVARLLECLEFDPEEFCHLLNAAEQQAKRNIFINYNDIPKYIISKLGLNKRDPFEEFAASINAETKTENKNNNQQQLTLSLSNNNVTINNDQEITSQSSNSNININSNNNNNNNTSSSSQFISRDGPKESDFEKIKLISNGAYGAVYLVRYKQQQQNQQEQQAKHTIINDELINKRFAMKEIKKHDLILRNQLKQVFTERDIMIFTDNPFVVALICTFETKKHLCMVMEYVEGGDVATLIKNMGPLPLDMARTYFAETTLAVEYLHNYGIIHRDLKPDNLLITSLGHIKLTDFGLSKVGLMNLTTNFYEGDYMKDHYCKEFNDKQICGTPQYLAPEVILRQSYGKAVDWWSMGIILYEFLTSIAPYNGATPEELFDNVINSEIEWPDDDDQLKIPDDAKDLINGLLQHDPMHRLGADSGALEIKKHLFFYNLDWDNLLRIKAKFIPELEGPDDTSYFDTRSDRYNHDDKDDDDLDAINLNAKETSSDENYNDAPSTPNKLLDLNKNNFRLTVDANNTLDDSLTYISTPDNNNKRANSYDTDTDSELFASFSSYSSRFKLCSNDNSVSNSPVIVNENRFQQAIQPLSFSLPSSETKKSHELKQSSEIQSEEKKFNKTNEKESAQLIQDIEVAKIQAEFEAKLNLEDNNCNSKSKTTTDESEKSSIVEVNTPTQAHPLTNLEESIKKQETDQSALSVELKQEEDRVVVQNETVLSNTPTPTPTPALAVESNLESKQTNSRKHSQSISTTGVNSSNKRTDSQNASKSHSSARVNNSKYYRANNNNDNHSKFNAYSTPSSSTTTPNSTRLSSASFNSKRNESNLSPLNRQYSSPMSRPSARYDSRPKSQLITPTFNNNTTNPASTYTKSNKNRYSNNSRMSANQYNESAVNEMVNLGLNKPELVIRRGIRGYGFTLRAIQVYYDDTDFYTIQHIVIQVDEQGPAYQAGLRFNDIITHVNDEVVCGKVHHEIVKLILSSVNHMLRLRAVNLNETKIKNNGRKRSPSKIKLAQLNNNNNNNNNNNIQNVLITAAHVASASTGISTNEAFFDQQNYSNYVEFRNLSPYALNTPGNQSAMFNYNQANSLTNLNQPHQQFNANNNSSRLLNPPYGTTSSQAFLNSRRHIGGSTTSVADYILPAAQHERKKKTTLLRKLSEKRAHKYEFMQQQQQQMQSGQQPPAQMQQRLLGPKVSSSSSSSSSSSLNNSFSNNYHHQHHKPKCPPSLVSQISCSPPSSSSKQRNVSTNDLRLSFYNPTNKWIDYTDTQQQQQQQPQQTLMMNQQQVKSKQAWSSSPSPFEDSPSSSSFLFHSNFYSSSANSTASNSPVNSQPNSPANRFNASSTNRFTSSSSSCRPKSLIVVKNSSTPSSPLPQPSAHLGATHAYSIAAPQPAKHSSSSASASPQIILTQNQQFFYDPQQQQQQQQQNKLFIPNNNSSFTSITQKSQFNNNSNSSKLQTNQQQQSQQQQQQPLSPSPLAISDGMPISYGNSHVTQTFTPVNNSNINNNNNNNNSINQTPGTVDYTAQQNLENLN